MTGEKKKRAGRMSLQWRLTLMAAAVTAAACLVLTLVIGKTANTTMDEISGIFIAGSEGDAQEQEIEEIEIMPEYYEKLHENKQSFQVQSLAAMAGIILTGSLLTYFIAGRALKQLHEFGDTVEQIQVQNLSEPMDGENLPKELRRLSRSFNKMLVRLEESFDGQKQFSANAAHELRTPLAVMQTKIEVFRKEKEHSGEEYEQVLDMLEVQTERLTHIVEELLELSRLQSARRTDRIVPAELVEEVLMDLSDVAEKKEITLQFTGAAGHGSEATEFPGNEVLIYRAVFNLVENAVKYNRQGGQVLVSVEEDADNVVLTVADTGPGIPEEYQEQIFEPFFRVDKSRSREMGGAGIGLAMVKKIAELHGGSVYVKESTEAGSRIVMELPVR